MENNDFRQMQQRLKSLPILLKRREGMRKNIEEVNFQLERLLKDFEKEKRDVEKISKLSFSSILVKAIGKYEERMSKEQKEEMDAKLKYDKEVQHLNLLNEDLKEINERIRKLEKEKDEYEKECMEREKKLQNCAEGDVVVRYRENEEKRNKLLEECAQIDEVIKIGLKIMNVIESIRNSLKGAEGWATYDVFSNRGFLSNHIKYEHLDRAARGFSELSSLLEDFKRELKEEGNLNLPIGVGIDNSTRIVDYWFDNLFTDLRVRNKILEDQQQVNSIAYHIEKVISDLESARKVAEKKLEQLGKEKEEILSSSFFCLQ